MAPRLMHRRAPIDPLAASVAAIVLGQADATLVY